MNMGSASSSAMMSMAMSSSTPTASSSMNMGGMGGMGHHTTASMSMPMSSSTGSSSMDMGMHMSMNTFLTTKYSGYPVVFKNLSAASGGAAFGIFCVLFFTAFAFRGLGFLSAYLEQTVFRDPKKFDLSENETDHHTHHDEKDVINESTRSTDMESVLVKKRDAEKNRSVIAKFFAVTPSSLYRDFIRVILAFVSAMLGYALMLAAMSFIIPYFFAIILGLSFGEVFFHRLASVMEINTNNSICESLH
ncbi:unnamed protein product [Wickerhamomyces anomalus]